MAQRPIFRCSTIKSSSVEELVVEFPWVPGLSTAQKVKRIDALHRYAKAKHGIENILEISSVSPNPLGRRLSAFNLSLYTPNGGFVTVEEAYQSSKVFERGGPFRDLLGVGPRLAKRDERLTAHGSLIRFSWFGLEVATSPTTLFYDWLYLKALNDNPSLHNAIERYESFSDIEFNPKRSWACQARSAALWNSLAAIGLQYECAENCEKLRGQVDQPRDDDSCQRALNL